MFVPSTSDALCSEAVLLQVAMHHHLVEAERASAEHVQRVALRLRQSGRVAVPSSDIKKFVC